MLACADHVVCTPDSVNMLSEACATAVPVHVFEPACAGGRIGAFLSSLIALDRVRAVDGALAPFAVVPLRETERVAAAVRGRLASPARAGDK